MDAHPSITAGPLLPTAVVLAPCPSPLGPMTLAAAVGGQGPSGGLLVGCWFDGQAHDRRLAPRLGPVTEPTSPGARGGDGVPAVLEQARAWLAAYFGGEDPGDLPPLALAGTPFQEPVWAQLAGIARGSTLSYGQLAARVGQATGRRCPPRAVAGAVARNPLSVLLPCHRVLGAGGALTGYAGGLWRKTALLRLEGALPAGRG